MQPSNYEWSRKDFSETGQWPGNRELKPCAEDGTAGLGNKLFGCAREILPSSHVCGRKPASGMASPLQEREAGIGKTPNLCGLPTEEEALGINHIGGIRGIRLMIHYRVVANVCPVSDGTAECSHLFVARVDEKEFCRALCARDGATRNWPLPNGDGILKSEIEEMVTDMMMYRELGRPGMVVSLKITQDAAQVGETVQKKIPDLTGSGISLWYCGEGIPAS